MKLPICASLHYWKSNYINLPKLLHTKLQYNITTLNDLTYDTNEKNVIPNIFIIK